MSPILICTKCHLPCPDSFHDFSEACECIDWKAMAKRKGWKLRFPDDKTKTGHFIDWQQMRKKMKHNAQKYMNEHDVKK